MHDMLLMELGRATGDLRHGAAGVLAPMRPRAPNAPRGRTDTRRPDGRTRRWERATRRRRRRGN